MFRDKLFGTASRICFAPDDGGAGGGGDGAGGAAGAGAGGAAGGGASGGDGGAASWYSGISDEGIRGVASKYESEAKFLDALGYEQPTDGDWRTGLPDDLKEHASRFNSVADLVRGNSELRSERDRLRTTAIVKPGKDAKPEEIASYRKALGVPDAPEGYKFPDAPQGQTLSDEVKAERAEWAKEFHEAGLSSAQAERLVAKFATVAQAKETALADADKRFAQESETALRKEWGNDFDRNKEFASRGFADMAQRAGVAVDELRQVETKSGRFLMDDPRMLRIFAAIGREGAEGSLGPAVTEDQRQSIKTELATVRAQITEAQGKGDSKEANRLYQAEQRLIAKMNGTRSVVGAQGRAA